MIFDRKVLFINPNNTSGIVSTITGDTLYFTFYLNQTMDDIGIYTDSPRSNGGSIAFIGMSEFGKQEWVNGYPNFIITGTTDDKINQIKTYSVANPLQIGVNGVTSIGNGSTGYTFDGGGTFDIDYITTDDQTSFSAGTQALSMLYGQNQLGNALLFKIYKDETQMGWVFPPVIDDQIDIDRGVTNVFENHFVLGSLNTLEDITLYGNGFFNIN